MIDRKSRQAAQQLVEQGRDRMKDGFWIVIFPEGTRMPPGQLGKFKQGGARLALSLDVPTVPVALNSGTLWPRNAFLKYPGTVEVIIGPAILPAGHSADSLTQAVEQWISAQQAELPGNGAAARH